MKKKCKTSVELMMEVRREWNINPRTRIKENELKDKKKNRQKGKKVSRGYDTYGFCQYDIIFI